MLDNSSLLHMRKLRLRNSIIEYFELASSPEGQREYERLVPIAQVPAEIICQWEECARVADFDWYSAPEFSAEEQAAIRQFHATWNSVVADTPDVMPYTIDDLIGTPVWQRLIEAAGAALGIFEKRGKIDESKSI